MLSEKYLQVIKNTWDEYFVYRLNFVMWRVRVVLQFFVVYFLWVAVFSTTQGETLFGYTESRILTYILLGSFLSAVIFSTRSLDVGDQISRGDLTNFLIRPINYFLYKIAQDVSDKTLNIFFALFEITVILLIFKPPLLIQTDPTTLVLFAFSIILAVILFFLTSFLLGMVGFWSSQVWAPRFLFFVFTSFLSGGLFPLDILPKNFFIVLSLSPFPYFLYFPLKVYLGDLAFLQILIGFLASCVWVLLLAAFVKIVWQKGMSIYEAVGR